MFKLKLYLSVKSLKSEFSHFSYCVGQPKVGEVLWSVAMIKVNFETDFKKMPKTQNTGFIIATLHSTSPAP